jgi:hypothetical protein
VHGVGIHASAKNLCPLRYDIMAVSLLTENKTKHSDTSSLTVVDSLSGQINQFIQGSRYMKVGLRG